MTEVILNPTIVKVGREAGVGDIVEAKIKRVEETCVDVI